jgi:hypothetical protein
MIRIQEGSSEMGVQHVVQPQVASVHGSEEGLVEWFLIRATGNDRSLERGRISGNGNNEIKQCIC